MHRHVTCLSVISRKYHSYYHTGNNSEIKPIRLDSDNLKGHHNSDPWESENHLNKAVYKSRRNALFKGHYGIIIFHNIEFNHFHNVRVQW